MDGSASRKVAVIQKTAPGAFFGGVFPKAAIVAGTYLSKIEPIGNIRAFMRKCGADIVGIKFVGFEPSEEHRILMAFRSRRAAFKTGRHISAFESVVMIIRETPPGETGVFRAWGPIPGKSVTSGDYLSSDKNTTFETGDIEKFMSTIPPGIKVVIFGATAAEEQMFAATGKQVYCATAPCGEKKMKINPIVPDI